MGVPVITGSQTVPVITFIKFSFWKTNKNKSLFRYVFFLYIYIYQNLYCFKTDEQLFRWHLFSLSNVLIYELQGKFSTVWLCFLFMSCHTKVLLRNWIEWLRCVCLFRAYVRVCAFVRVCMSDWDDGLYCQLNYPSVTGQGRQRPTCLKKRRKSLPVIILKTVVWKHCCCTLAWYGLSPLSSCIEPLFHFKEPLPIYSPHSFYICPTVITLREQRCCNLWTLASVCFHQLLTLLRCMKLCSTAWVFFAKSEETRT